MADRQQVENEEERERDKVYSDQEWVKDLNHTGKQVKTWQAVTKETGVDFHV